MEIPRKKSLWDYQKYPSVRENFGLCSTYCKNDQGLSIRRIKASFPSLWFRTLFLSCRSRVTERRIQEHSSGSRTRERQEAAAITLNHKRIVSSLSSWKHIISSMIVAGPLDALWEPGSGWSPRSLNENIAPSWQTWPPPCHYHQLGSLGNPRLKPKQGKEKEVKKDFPTWVFVLEVKS